MYNPDTYLSKEIIIEELACYDWANSLVIDEKDCTIDGIKVRLPNCIIYFREGFESDMSAYIANPSNENKYWSIFELVNLPEIKSKCRQFNFLINDVTPFASVSKVINGVKDICATIDCYLQQFITGDFSVIENKRTI